MKDHKMGLDVAQQELARFIESMHLDIDKGKMKPEDLEAYEKQESVLLNAIQNGSMIVNDKGEPAAFGLTFREPRGADFMAMDRRKTSESYAKMLVLMGSITGEPVETFAKMENHKLKVCQAVVIHFLA